MSRKSNEGTEKSTGMIMPTSGNDSSIMDKTFDIARYVRTQAKRMDTADRLDDMLNKIEELMFSEKMRKQLRPKDILLLYQSLVRRQTMETQMVKGFVNDAVNNTLLKQRLSLEQRRLEQEVDAAERRGVGDPTVGALAASLKSILRTGKIPDTDFGEDDGISVIDEDK